MDGTALTGWMYSTTIMEDGTLGAPSVAHILGCPCMGAMAPKNGCEMAIGRGCVRPPPGPKKNSGTAQAGPSGARGVSVHVACFHVIQCIILLMTHSITKHPCKIVDTHTCFCGARLHPAAWGVCWGNRDALQANSRHQVSVPVPPKVPSCPHEYLLHPFRHAVTSVLLRTALKGACLLIPMSCDCMLAMHLAAPNLTFDNSDKFSRLQGCVVYSN
jgi:hypothetical protein